jgi:hypothetical protein
LLATCATTTRGGAHVDSPLQKTEREMLVRVKNVRIQHPHIGIMWVILVKLIIGLFR